MPSFTSVVPRRRALVSGLGFAICILSLRLLVVGRYYSWRAVAFSALEARLFYWVGPAAVAVLFGGVERLFRRQFRASRD